MTPQWIVFQRGAGRACRAHSQSGCLGRRRKARWVDDKRAYIPLVNFVSQGLLGKLKNAVKKDRNISEEREFGSGSDISSASVQSKQSTSSKMSTASKLIQRAR